MEARPPRLGAVTASRSRRPEDNEPLLGALLRIPYQAMMVEAVEPGLAEAGYGDVRPAHFVMLQALCRREGGMRSTELAARARITKQSMGYLVEYLEERGYVARVPDPTDRRAQLVRLTERGWEAVWATRDLVRQAEADWAARIGTERVETLRQLLRALVAGRGGTTRPQLGYRRACRRSEAPRGQPTGA
jgi:DNA-binding MarR family transcriptional regulator